MRNDRQAIPFCDFLL